MDPVDVAIVGAGISGLAAAYELQRSGTGVRLLEASDRLGGVIRTDRIDGWVIDGGPDSMLVQKPAAVGLCRELGIADRLVSTADAAQGVRPASWATASDPGGIVPRISGARKRAGELVAVFTPRQAANGVRSLDSR